ncbi:RNA-directed DNA polymerase, eukaryota [Tanacetum coccineum]
MVVSMQEDIRRRVNDVTSPRIVEKEQNEQERINNYNGSKDEMPGSVCSSIFKKPVAPQSGGSILCVLEELVKVGQAMGYNMKGCVNNISEIIESQGVSGETKMENMNLWCVKACWGNYTFDYAHSDSVGNSGGILCIWDPNSFQKDNVTVSDFFIIIRGTWLKSGVKILMVAVYAPHDLRDKKILWDYLEYIINRWDGEVLIMGDFNEVRRKTERFGSVFNVQGADMFNTFIANAGLEEIPLGGSSFTWCHKSATKMSKLDRFLISENLFNSYPNICATSLDRFLSDHRPILLRESNHDYGPIPFRYFNHWTELDGFNKFVIDTWNSAPVETNAMRNVMQKFKFLKGKIREWLKIYKSKNGGSGILKEELNRIDADIDKGLASDIIINRRMEVIKSIQYLDKIHVMDLAQKAKQTELEGAVSKEEVKKAVWDCGSDKSPGPDGFSYSLSFQSVVDVGLFKGIHLSPLVNLSHMFYADDAVFVGQWCDDNINTLVHVLECFFRASVFVGQWCDDNIKSKIMGVNVGDDKIKVAASKLGCLILDTPFTYLGTKVGGNMSRVQAWTKIIDKVKSCLSNWKLKSLSIGALLMKWFWRFYSHNDSLWSRVIKAIYGVDGEVNKVSKYASRSCWRDIINEVRKLKDQGINMRGGSDFMYIKVGNGETTKFWDDIWIGSKPLKLLFPRIYALDNIKDATICMKLNEPSLDNNFRRSIRGGIEQSQFKELTDLLIPIVLNPCPDRMVSSFEWDWGHLSSSVTATVTSLANVEDNRFPPQHLAAVAGDTVIVSCVFLVVADDTEAVNTTPLDEVTGDASRSVPHEAMAMRKEGITGQIHMKQLNLQLCKQGLAVDKADSTTSLPTTYGLNTTSPYLLHMIQKAPQKVSHSMKQGMLQNTRYASMVPNSSQTYNVKFALVFLEYNQLSFWRLIRVVEAKCRISRCARFSSDGRYIASASVDTSIKLFEVSKLKQMMLPEGRVGPVRPLLRMFFDHL